MLSKLVNDIIKNEHVPSILYVKNCGSKSDTINFVKSISIATEIVKSFTSINLQGDENTNKQWFFVDMKCNQTILSSVDEKYLAHPYRWIIVDAVNDSIANLNILPGSYIVIANQDTDSEQFNLKQSIFKN